MDAGRSSDEDYDTLKANAARHWHWVQETRKAERAQREAAYAESPDVAHPPDRSTPTAFAGVTCDHGHQQFFVERWIVLNGVRYRMQARCAEEMCPFYGTYDFLKQDWLWRPS